ncbi:MbtH family NRPS accessory protein [Streptomyces sp. CA-251387]|uniref:MbtH family NRPS accessory protein n=1 Tax=Streptomyces sp. CA-251387 TaxID=3240064 RepID=UPI003D8C6BFC
MTHPFDPAGTGDPTHLVLADAAGRRSLWPTWLRIPPGWTTDFGPASHEDCLRSIDVPLPGRDTEPARPVPQTLTAPDPMTPDPGGNTMSGTRNPIDRRAVLGAAIAAGGALGSAGTASAATPDRDRTRDSAYAVKSAELAQGLYQVAHSTRNGVLWVTSSIGYPPVTRSRLLKVDPRSLKLLASTTPPVTDEATGALEAVYGVAVDDVHNTVWVTATLSNALAVYSQRTGRHLATLPGVRHPRDVAVDIARGLVWCSALEEGAIVAFDLRTYQEKKRVTVEGAWPAGLAVDPYTGNVYAADLAKSRLIEVAAGSDRPRILPAGQGSIDVALAADGRTAYTANQAAGSVSVVDLASGEVKNEIKTGAGTLAVATDICTGRVFAANKDAGTTTVLDPRAGTVLADLATGANTDHVVLAHGTAYVVDKAAAGPETIDSIHRISPPR